MSKLNKYLGPAKILLDAMVGRLPWDEQEIKAKLKCFKPTITNDFWGSKTVWTERESPLSDEELAEKYLVN